MTAFLDPVYHRTWSLNVMHWRYLSTVLEGGRFCSEFAFNECVILSHIFFARGPIGNNYQLKNLITSQQLRVVVRIHQLLERQVYSHFISPTSWHAYFLIFLFFRQMIVIDNYFNDLMVTLLTVNTAAICFSVFKLVNVSRLNFSKSQKYWVNNLRTIHLCMFRNIS